jgi:multicomponent Na+:H+ antiporter subunit D
MILLAVFAPFVAGMLCLLLQRGLRTIPIAAYLLTAVISLRMLLFAGTPLHLHLTGSFGISLLLDRSAAWFLLLNALVCGAVAWHERARGRHHYFFILLVLLHGCLNACFVSNDLFNLFVVIELATIISFLMVGQGLSTRHIWNALRYLFLSNVGMLFFLLGTLLVYEHTGGFSLGGAAAAPPSARALIVTGLLVKGGVFLPGLWLPQAHAEAEAAVSALLSGVVVKIGLLPLMRLESGSPDLESVIRITGFGGAFLGLALALFQRDIKRLLACSTISQVGIILVSPAAGPLYAFAHGAAKAVLFLCAGGLPERDLLRLRETGVSRSTGWLMKLAALSIAGWPLLLGFPAKYAVGSGLSGWAAGLFAAASLGTAVLLTPVLLLPHRAVPGRLPTGLQAPACLAAVLLLGGIVAGPWSLSAWAKAAGTVAAGMLLHVSLFRRLMPVRLPDRWERLEHVVGLTCLVLIFITITVYLP